MLFTSLTCSAEDNSVITEFDSIGLNRSAYSKLQLGDYENSYKLATEALVQASEEGNQMEVARAYSNIASNLRYFGEVERALELYLKSLNESEKINDASGINRAYNNLATVYSDIGDLVEVKKYRQLQLENSFETADLTDQIIAYVGLAQLENKNKKFQLAENYLALAREILIEKPNPFLEVYVLMTEGDLSAAKGNLDRAIVVNQLANEIAKKNNFQGLVIGSKVNIAEFYLNQKEYQKAIDAAESLIHSTVQIRLQTKTLQLHSVLNKAYEAIEDYKNALLHERKMDQLKQRFAGQKVKFIGEVFKVDRQFAEQQEKLLEMEKDQKIMALTLEQQKKNQIIWIAFAILIFGLSFFLYYRFTSRREILRQKQLNQRLEELDKVKDRVLTNTSHELRTPLNGIIGLSDIIIKDEENKFSESTLNCLKLIKSSGEQLALVINDILELSKLKNSVVTIVKSKFDLQELVRDVVAVCEPNLRGKKIKFVNKNEGKKIVVFLDRGRLQQILFNIIGNAIKFTEMGSIEIDCVVANAQLKIEVKDTGKGIPTDNLERVFEGFEQVDAGNSREQSGTGLGLAITKSIVEAMGGSIKLISEISKGTRVTVILPQ